MASATPGQQDEHEPPVCYHEIPKSAVTTQSRTFSSDVPCTRIFHDHPLARKVKRLMEERAGGNLSQSQGRSVLRDISILAGEHLWGFKLLLMKGALPGDHVDARCLRCLERGLPCISLGMTDAQGRLQVISACFLCSLVSDTCSLRGPAAVQYRESFNSKNQKANSIQKDSDLGQSLKLHAKQSPELAFMAEPQAEEARKRAIAGLEAPISQSPKRQRSAAAGDRRTEREEHDSAQTQMMLDRWYNIPHQPGELSTRNKIKADMTQRKPKNWQAGQPLPRKTYYKLCDHQTPAVQEWDAAAEGAYLLQTHALAAAPINPADLNILAGKPPADRDREPIRGPEGRWASLAAIERCGNILTAMMQHDPQRGQAVPRNIEGGDWDAIAAREPCQAYLEGFAALDNLTYAEALVAYHVLHAQPPQPGATPLPELSQMDLYCHLTIMPLYNSHLDPTLPDRFRQHWHVQPAWGPGLD